MLEPLRLGLVGAGRWGRNYIGTIGALPETRVVAVASRNAQTAALVPTGCRIAADWRELVGASDIDGVIIATPPAAHTDILLATIEAGIAALVEKPLAQGRGDAERVRAALAGRRAVVFVDHLHLFHSGFRALQREARSLGPIRAIRAAAGNLGPYRPDVPVLWDWAPHDLAMALTLAPGPARALRAARLEQRPVEGAMAETLALEVELAGGIPASIALTTLKERHRHFAVTFDDCTLVYRDAGPASLTRLRPGEDIGAPGEILVAQREPPLAQALREFAAAIRSNDTSPTSIDLGLAVVDLIADLDDLLGT